MTVFQVPRSARQKGLEHYYTDQHGGHQERHQGRFEPPRSARSETLTPHPHLFPHWAEEVLGFCCYLVQFDSQVRQDLRRNNPPRRFRLSSSKLCP